MASGNRLIFRAEAVRRYIQNQQKAVLPQFFCPRAFLYLWLLLGLLLLGAGLVTSRIDHTLAAGQSIGVYR
jgi:hypothetical protein